MELQNSGMLSRDQLLYLFDRFASLTSQPGNFSSFVSLSFFHHNFEHLSLLLLLLLKIACLCLKMALEVKKRIADAVNDKQVNLRLSIIGVIL